jgi:hypothetical protein
LEEGSMLMYGRDSKNLLLSVLEAFCRRQYRCE